MAGADLESRTTAGFTPLMDAAAFNDNPEVVQVLIEAGANLEARTDSGFTPLMDAAGFSTNPQVVIKLLAQLRFPLTSDIKG